MTVLLYELNRHSALNKVGEYTLVVTVYIHVTYGCSFSCEHVECCLHDEAFPCHRITDRKTFYKTDQAFIEQDICFRGMERRVWVENMSVCQSVLS